MEAGSKNRLATSMRRLQVSCVGYLRPGGRTDLCQPYLHEDNYPGSGVVVTAVGVNQAHCVHQWCQQGPQLGEIYTLNTLQEQNHKPKLVYLATTLKCSIKGCKCSVMSSASFKAFKTFLNIDLNRENMEKLVRKC